jgi:hypothetical protein
MFQPLDLLEEGAALTEQDKESLCSLRVRFWGVGRCSMKSAGQFLVLVAALFSLAAF